MIKNGGWTFPDDCVGYEPVSSDVTGHLYVEGSLQFWLNPIWSRLWGGVGGSLFLTCFQDVILGLDLLFKILALEFL